MTNQPVDAAREAAYRQVVREMAEDGPARQWTLVAFNAGVEWGRADERARLTAPAHGSPACRECRAGLSQALSMDIGWRCMEHGVQRLSDHVQTARLTAPETPAFWNGRRWTSVWDAERKQWLPWIEGDDLPDTSIRALAEGA